MDLVALACEGVPGPGIDLVSPALPKVSFLTTGSQGSAMTSSLITSVMTLFLADPYSEVLGNSVLGLECMSLGNAVQVSMAGFMSLKFQVRVVSVKPSTD